MGHRWIRARGSIGLIGSVTNATNTMIEKRRFLNYGEPISQTFCAQSRRGDLKHSSSRSPRLATHISHNPKIKTKTPPSLHPRNPNLEPNPKHAINRQCQAKPPSEQNLGRNSNQSNKYNTVPTPKPKPLLQNRHIEPFPRAQNSQNSCPTHRVTHSLQRYHEYIHTADPRGNGKKIKRSRCEIPTARKFDKIHSFHCGRVGGYWP